MGAQLWYVHGDVAYNHLQAASDPGYELGASYALYQSERTQPAMLDWQATLVAGQVTYEGGEASGPLPGRLIRGPQAAPA